jgi:hypothetical protein
VEVGHVLATMRKGEKLSRTGRPHLFGNLFGSNDFDVKPNPMVPDTVIASSSSDTTRTIDPAKPLVLPDERSGLVFVFRTFEKLSYGMIMKSIRPISVGDIVRTP